MDKIMPYTWEVHSHPWEVYVIELGDAFPKEPQPQPSHTFDVLQGVLPPSDWVWHDYLNKSIRLIFGKCLGGALTRNSCESLENTIVAKKVTYLIQTSFSEIDNSDQNILTIMEINLVIVVRKTETVTLR